MYGDWWFNIGGSPATGDDPRTVLLTLVAHTSEKREGDVSWGADNAGGADNTDS